MKTPQSPPWLYYITVTGLTLYYSFVTFVPKINSKSVLPDLSLLAISVTAVTFFITICINWDDFINAVTKDAVKLPAKLQKPYVVSSIVFPFIVLPILILCWFVLSGIEQILGLIKLIKS